MLAISPLLISRKVAIKLGCGRPQSNRTMLLVVSRIFCAIQSMIKGMMLLFVLSSVDFLVCFFQSLMTDNNAQPPRLSAIHQDYTKSIVIMWLVVSALELHSQLTASISTLIFFVAMSGYNLICHIALLV